MQTRACVRSFEPICREILILHEVLESICKGNYFFSGYSPPLNDGLFLKEIFFFPGEQFVQLRNSPKISSFQLIVPRKWSPCISLFPTNTNYFEVILPVHNDILKGNFPVRNDLLKGNLPVHNDLILKSWKWYYFPFPDFRISPKIISLKSPFNKTVWAHVLGCSVTVMNIEQILNIQSSFSNITYWKYEFLLNAQWKMCIKMLQCDPKYLNYQTSDHIEFFGD